MNSSDFFKQLMAFAAGAGMVLAIGRWVGNIEVRLQDVERVERYYHGEKPDLLK